MTPLASGVPLPRGRCAAAKTPAGVSLGAFAGDVELLWSPHVMGVLAGRPRDEALPPGSEPNAAGDGARTVAKPEVAASASARFRPRYSPPPRPRTAPPRPPREESPTKSERTLAWLAEEVTASPREGSVRTAVVTVFEPEVRLLLVGC